MHTYLVWLRLTADSSDELMERIHTWEVGDDEGVVTVTHEPENVEVPDRLKAPPLPDLPLPEVAPFDHRVAREEAESK
jgi:hypothetical protein